MTALPKSQFPPSLCSVCLWETCAPDVTVCVCILVLCLSFMTQTSPLIHTLFYAHTENTQAQRREAPSSVRSKNKHVSFVNSCHYSRTRSQKAPPGDGQYLICVLCCQHALPHIASLPRAADAPVSYYENGESHISPTGCSIL